MTGETPRAPARWLNWRWRLGIGLFAMLVAVFLLSRCAFINSGGIGRVWWSERVQLHDGTSAVLARYVRFTYWNNWFETGTGGEDELESRIAFATSRGALPQWRSPLIPLLFDTEPATGRPILIATTLSCDTWRALGGPPNTYWTFTVVGDRWQETALPAAFVGRAPNLLFTYSFKDNWLYIPSFVVERRKAHQITPALMPTLKTIEPAPNRWRC